jgi:hypothetical protein
MKDRFYTNNYFDTTKCQSVTIGSDLVDTTEIVLNLQASGYAGYNSTSFYVVQTLRFTVTQAREIVEALSIVLDRHEDEVIAYEEAKSLAELDAQRDLEEVEA